MAQNMQTQAIQMSGSKIAKAVWNKNTINIYCDICIRAIHKNMRPGTHFNKEGWRYVIQNFQKESEKSYGKAQLKNKWDSLKKEWRLWKELQGKETGLGWSTSKQTIDASDEWWDEKIKVSIDILI